MKWFVLTIWLVISVANAEVGNENRGVLRRTVRQAMDSMGGVFLKQTEKTVILNCEKNGLTSDGAERLQRTYDDMKRCMSSPRIFSVPKSEYISKMVSCSSEAVSQTRDCLAPNQKYFPDFVLDLAKSVVSFIYDDKSTIASMNVASCMRNFLRREVQMTYAQCVTTISVQTHDDENIPPSKADFCAKFLPAGECFPSTLNQYCDKNSSVLKFLEDYKKALEQPCEKKEN